MIFKVSTAKSFYDDPEKIAKLKAMGFHFVDSLPCAVMPPKPGEVFKVDSEDDPRVEINNLDELLEFSDEWGTPIIIKRGSIEIYDDWRE